MKAVFTFHGKLAALSLALLLPSCISDHSYDVDNLKDIDPSVTLFNDGITLPLGQTERIAVPVILDLSKKGLDTLLVADSLTGDYALEVSGNRDLQDVIAKMQLDKLRNIDGSSFSKTIDYKIGEIDPSQFTIEGKQFSYDSPNFPIFNLDDIPVPSFQFPDQVIATELYKYMPSDLDIGKKVGDVKYSEKIIAVNDIKAYTDLWPQENIPIQQVLTTIGIDNYTIQNYQKQIKETLDLGANASQISDIKDFKLKKGSAIKISLAVENAPFTGGTVTPDINLDMTSLFTLSGASAQTGKLNLSSLIMSGTNGWKSEKSYEITGLAAGFPTYSNGKLALNGNVSLEGAVKISDATSTKTKVNSLAGKDMKLSVTVSCDGIVLETMEIIVGSGAVYELPEQEIPIEISYDLPQGIKSVNKVYFDQGYKFEVTIYAKGLDNLISADGTKHLGIYPYVKVTLPEGLEVAEAVNNKIEISGMDLFDGPIQKTFTLVSITPKNADGKLTYKDKIKAKVMAQATGTVSSKYLPTSAQNDVTVTTKVGCQPKFKDYDVTLDDTQMSRTISESKEFSFEMDGMGDFGTFRVNLEGSPKATLSFNIPATSEVNFVAENLVIAIPQMMVIDGSAISGFDAAKNTITLNGQIPAKIELPIQYLRVTPQKDESGKTVVKGVYSINGKVKLDNLSVTRKTFDELSGKKVNVQATIPSMKATSISLEGDFNKSLDHDMKDIVILDSKTVSELPKEIKKIEDILLEGVNAIIELKVTGLPDMVGEFYLKDTKIIMPEFITGEGGTNVLVLDDKIPVRNGETIRQSIGITNIKNVQLEGITELKGDVLLRSTLTSHKPEVDLSTLQGTVKADVSVGVGNGQTASSPGKIVVSTAKVKVAYDYEDSQTISLGDIPEELQADSVNLALNPNLYLDLTTNFGAPVKGDFVITPYINDEALEEETVYINGIEIPCSDDWQKIKTNRYAIGMNPKLEPDMIAIRTDLSGLVKRIPDSLKIEIKINVDPTKDCVVYPAADYVCIMQYRFNVPVSFSEDFTLSLNPTVDIDSTTNEALKLAVVRLKGVCTTTLPLGTDCNIKLLDSEDKEIELKQPASLKILPSPDGKKEVVQSFDVILDIKDRENLKATKLLFAMSMKTSPDVNLNTGQFIQVTDLKLVLPEGISFNLEIKGE